MKTQTKEEAIDKVRKNNQTFYNVACDYSLNWLKRNKGDLTSEHIIDDFRKHNEASSEPRVWGAVMKKLSKDRCIIPVGWDIYKKKQGHSRPIRVWSNLITI